MKRYGSLGIIGRFKPLHNGHAALLDALFAHANEVTLGIGSATTYNAINPLTADETEAMLRSYLDARQKTPYRIRTVPDVDLPDVVLSGTIWAQHVREEFGPLDGFVTGNPWVHTLLEPHYTMVPIERILPHERLPLSATMVRTAIAQGESWKTLVPPQVAQYLQANTLIERIQREFGHEYE